VNAVQHRHERDVPLGVTLRVEEHLDVCDALAARAPQIGRGQGVEVVLIAQHLRCGQIDVEE
jgi:hypothetical protein